MRAYRHTVGQRFASIVERYGDRPALRYPESTVTYRELDARAATLARAFQQAGIGSRDVVGIVHTKTVACYAAMLAALNIGAAYVNLDDENPPARLAHIFSTARPKLVVGENASNDIISAVKAAGTAFLDLSATKILDRQAAADVITGAEPAYIMYTSGSTGVPKGAIMTHANVLNFASWCAERFAITPDDVLTNVNPMYFDNSVFDFYGALLNGASIAPVERAALADAASLVSRVEAARCTIWFSVPSLLIFLMKMRVLTAKRLPSIRQFVFGGEGYPKPELRKLFAAFGDRCRLVNVYGPTECTCMCSAWDVGSDDLSDLSGLVTLGPIAKNFSALVLQGQKPVSPGEIGELYLGGPQVGLGYMNDPERTSRSFVFNPLNDAWRERLYRTGDLIRLDTDGRRLHFVGRADNQIKHMGYRIELEEIEAALVTLQGVIQCAVVQKTGRGGLKNLVAYVSSSQETNEADLRAGLMHLLPPYMVPQRFEIRDALPKNANGKIDRIALMNE